MFVVWFPKSNKRSCQWHSMTFLYIPTFWLLNMSNVTWFACQHRHHPSASFGDPPALARPSSVPNRRSPNTQGILLDLHEAFCFGAMTDAKSVCLFLNVATMRFADPVQGVAAVWRCAKLRKNGGFSCSCQQCWAALTIDLLRLFVEMSDTKSEHLLEVKHRSSRPVFISLRMHYPCSGFSIFLDSWTSTLVKQSRFHDMTDESRFITLKRPVPSPGFQA